MNAIFKNLPKQGFLSLGNETLNAMLGGGFKRGEFVGLPMTKDNLRHNFTIELLTRLTVYNEPTVKDGPSGFLHITLSPTHEQANVALVNDLYKIYDTLADLNFVDPRDGSESYTAISQACRDVLVGEGYDFTLMALDMSQMDKEQAIQFIKEKAESNKIKYHAVVINTLEYLFPKKEEDSYVERAQQARHIVRQIRNLFVQKDITFISPFFLSEEASKLSDTLAHDFLKEIALKGYYGSCSTLDQELDTELYLHVVKSNEQSALTVHRGKCRRIDAHQLPEPYTILPFSEHIPLGESVVAR